MGNFPKGLPARCGQGRRPVRPSPLRAMEGDESVPLIRNEGQGPSLRGVESPMKQRSACGNVVRRLFRRKRIEDILLEQSEDHEAGQGLSRSLTSFDLIA